MKPDKWMYVYVLYYYDPYAEGMDRWYQCDPVVYTTLEAAKAIPEKKTGRNNWREIRPNRICLDYYWIDRLPITDVGNAGIEVEMHEYTPCKTIPQERLKL